MKIKVLALLSLLALVSAGPAFSQNGNGNDGGNSSGSNNSGNGNASGNGNGNTVTININIGCILCGGGSGTTNVQGGERWHPPKALPKHAQ